MMCTEAPTIMQTHITDRYANTTVSSYFEQYVLPDDRRFILARDLLLELTKTVLTVIISDENDNAPKFLESVKYVAYPTALLAEKMMQQSLITVQATDADQGLNAEIRYEVLDTNLFVIHPKTGVVYPTNYGDGELDELVFRVRARDLDGSPAGKYSDLRIEVHMVTGLNLVQFHFANAMAEDVPDLLSQLNTYVKEDLMCLSFAILPSRLSRSWFRGYETRDTSMRMLIYGFDASHNVVDGSKLSNQFIENSIEIPGFEGWSSVYVGDDEFSITGYIAAISTLAVLLVVALVALFCGWWFLIRPSRTPDFSDINESLPENEETMADQPPDWSLHVESEDKLTMDIKRRTYEATALPKSLDDLLNDHNTNVSFDKLKDKESAHDDKKKSTVTFNENVERIDIDSANI